MLVGLGSGRYVTSARYRPVSSAAAAAAASDDDDDKRYDDDDNDDYDDDDGGGRASAVASSSSYESFSACILTDRTDDTRRTTHGILSALHLAAFYRPKLRLLPFVVDLVKA